MGDIAVTAGSTVRDAGPLTDLTGVRARPSVTSVSGVWFALTVTLLAGIAPLLLIAATPTTPDTSRVWVYAWLLGALVGVRYAWLVANGAARLFELVVWLFIYVFLAMAPLVQIRSGIYPGTTPDIDPALNGPAIAIVVVGTLAFAVGVLAAGHRTSPQVHRAGRTLGHHRVVVLSAVSMVCAAYYASRLGIGTLFSSRAERVVAEQALWPNDTVLAIVRAAATLPLVVSFAALLRLRHQRRAAGSSGPSLLPVLVLLAIFVVMNPIASPRYVSGTAALAIITALGAASSARRTRLFALTLAAGLVLIFPYADLARRAGEAHLDLRSGPAQVLSSSDFDAFDQINNTVAYVEASGYTKGAQITGAALFWVPRSVWSGKPEDTGRLVANFREYSVGNLSEPIWAELFIDGGWGLLVVAMMAFGWLARRLDNRALASTEAGIGRSVLAGIVPFYLILVLRGSLLQSMAGLSVLLVCAAAVTAPVRQRLAQMTERTRNPA